MAYPIYHAGPGGTAILYDPTTHTRPAPLPPGSRFYTRKTEVPLQPGQTLGFTPGAGYYARTGGGGGAPAGGAGQADSGPPYPGYMTQDEMEAEAERRAHGLYDPVLEQYKKQQERASFAHMAQQAGLAKLYDVLGGSMAGFSGQVSDIYNTAAQGLSSFDAGYGHGVELAKQSLQAQGAGYGQSFGALPAISGQQGAVKYLTAVQEGNAEDAKLTDLINATTAEIPGKTQEFLDSIQQDQAKTAGDYATLQSKEADRALKAGQQDRAYAWQVADRFTKNSDHFYTATQAKDGSWQVTDAGPKSANAGKPNVRTVGGFLYQLDPTSNKWVKVAGTGPSVQSKTVGGYIYERGPDGQWTSVAGTGPAPKQPSYTGSPYYPDPVTGQPKLKPGFHLDPSGNPVKDVKPATAKTPTPNQASAAVQGWYSGKTATERVPVMKDGKQVVNKNTGVPVYVSRTGQPTGRKTYQQAYRILTSKVYNLGDVAARQLLDQTYKRGERQRPWVSAPERAVLAKGGLSPVASFYKGQKGLAFLWPKQAQALQAAGMLPPGEMRNGRYFIQPGY